VVLGAAGWLPAPALGQVPAPPTGLRPTLTNHVLIAQIARKKVNWALWIGIGGGVVVVAGVVIAVAITRRPPPAPQATSPDIIGGYKILKPMATGHTSQVYEVVEMASGRHFALKMLLPEKARDSEHRRLLFHEAEVGLKLAHQNVI